MAAHQNGLSKIALLLSTFTLCLACCYRDRSCRFDHCKCCWYWCDHCKSWHDHRKCCASLMVAPLSHDHYIIWNLFCVFLITTCRIIPYIVVVWSSGLCRLIPSSGDYKWYCPSAMRTGWSQFDFTCGDTKYVRCLTKVIVLENRWLMFFCFAHDDPAETNRLTVHSMVSATPSQSHKTHLCEKYTLKQTFS